MDSVWGRMVDARELFVSMAIKGHECDVISYNVLINGYCKSLKIEEAMRFYRHMIGKRDQAHNCYLLQPVNLSVSGK